MRHRRLTTIPAVLVALALGATACGSAADEFADQSAKEISKDSAADVKKLTSMRMEGDLDAEGQKISFDLAMDRDGNCSGTLGIDKTEAELVVVADEATYIKGNKDFWSGAAGPQADAIVKLVGDKWAKLPSGTPGFDRFCDLEAFTAGGEKDNPEDLKKDGREDVDGTEAIVLSTKKDPQCEGTSKEWIAAEGEHYLLKTSCDAGDSTGEFTFSDFNDGVKAEAPAKKDVVDLSQG